MSAFSSLSEFWQTMLPFIMLVEIVLEIGLFMYQLLRSNKPVRSLLSLAVMAVMIPLLFSVSQADPDNIGDAFLLDAPWLIFAAAIFLAAVHFAIALPREYRRKKNELSQTLAQVLTHVSLHRKKWKSSSSAATTIQKLISNSPDYRTESVPNLFRGVFCFFVYFA